MARRQQAPNMDTFDAYFRRADLDQDGRISGAEAVAFFQGSNLPKHILAQIWMHADKNRTGFLGRPEFYNALKLVTVAQSGREIKSDIVKAALFGPAAAKIPPPQINPVPSPAPQMSAVAPPAAEPQLNVLAPSAPQTLGFRGPQVLPNAGASQQNFLSSDSQFMRPPQSTHATPPLPIQGINQGITAGRSVGGTWAPNSNSDWLGGRAGVPSNVVNPQVVSREAGAFLTLNGAGQAAPTVPAKLPRAQPAEHAAEAVSAQVVVASVPEAASEAIEAEQVLEAAGLASPIPPLRVIEDQPGSSVRVAAKDVASKQGETSPVVKPTGSIKEEVDQCPADQMSPTCPPIQAAARLPSLRLEVSASRVEGGAKKTPRELATPQASEFFLNLHEAEEEFINKAFANLKRHLSLVSDQGTGRSMDTEAAIERTMARVRFLECRTDGLEKFFKKWHENAQLLDIAQAKIASSNSTRIREAHVTSLTAREEEVGAAVKIFEDRVAERQKVRGEISDKLTENSLLIEKLKRELKAAEDTHANLQKSLEVVDEDIKDNHHQHSELSQQLVAIREERQEVASGIKIPEAVMKVMENNVATAQANLTLCVQDFLKGGFLDIYAPKD